MYSITNSNIGVVKLLLDAGCNLDLCGDKCKTLLYYLLNYGDIECTKKLILASQKSIPTNGSYYDFYLERKFDVLDDHMLRILKGEIVINKTKSTRKN